MSQPIERDTPHEAQVALECDQDRGVFGLLDSDEARNRIVAEGTATEGPS